MKGSGRHQSYKRILAGYDGSENAKRAMRGPNELAKESAADLRIGGRC